MSENTSQLKYRIYDDDGSIYESNEENELKRIFTMIKNQELKLKIKGELKLGEYELLN